MGAGIENPDGGEYVAAASKEDADAMSSRFPSTQAIYWSGAVMFCYPLALFLYFEYEAVKSNPAWIGFFVRLDLCILLLLCFVFIIIYLVVSYRFGKGPFKKEEA